MTEFSLESKAVIHRIIGDLAPGNGGVTRTGNGAVQLTRDSRLVDDLGYHSLALLELALALEDEFDLPPMNEQVAQEIRTVGDVEKFVIASVERKRGGSAVA